MSGKNTLILAQLNFLVGDIPGNCEKIIETVEMLHTQHPDAMVIFPELALTGYPPEDLLLREDFKKHTETALKQLTSAFKARAVILGAPHFKDDVIYNAAVVFLPGHPPLYYHKQRLPNYGVFDEKRYFTRGASPLIFTHQNTRFGIVVCEDLWTPEVAAQYADAGAEAIITINASPFDVHKAYLREKTLKQRSEETGLPFIYVHGVGGQDEVVFDGGSLVLDATQRICIQGPYFEEACLPCHFTQTDHTLKFECSPIPAHPAIAAQAYQALVLGVRDYVKKNGFKTVALGISGGIDSALTLAIAVDALGAENVHGVMLPSRYTSELSHTCARALMDNLKAHAHEISIEIPFENFNALLTQDFGQQPKDLTQQNIQARCRGLILMAFANEYDHLILTTGNKSEMAVGYATLYGDMAGAFAVLKDVPKTLVYTLCHYRNTLSDVIPHSIIERPPTAELAPNQKDVDTLPPYDILDAILERYIEHDEGVAEIIAQGFDEVTVRHVLKQVDRNEYKRRQAPPGVRITGRAFGRERRYPITSGFKHS